MRIEQLKHEHQGVLVGPPSIWQKVIPNFIFYEVAIYANLLPTSCACIKQSLALAPDQLLLCGFSIFNPILA